MTSDAGKMVAKSNLVLLLLSRHQRRSLVSAKMQWLSLLAAMAL